MVQSHFTRREIMTKAKLDIKEALRAVLQGKRLKSVRTAQWYETNVGALRAWLEEKGHSTLIGDLTEELVTSFMDDEASRCFKVAHRRMRNEDTGEIEVRVVKVPCEGLSPVSLDSKRRCLQAFGNRLVERGWLARNPFNAIEKAKLAKIQKKVLKPWEIEALIDGVNGQTAIGARDKAILYTFFDTGIRVSELSSLSMAKINLSDEDGGPWIRVLGKDAEERRIGLGEGASEAIHHYIEGFRPDWVPFPPERAEKLKNDGIRLAKNPVLLTVRGRGWGRGQAGGQQLTPNAISLIIYRLSRKLGIEEVSCHTARRTFATRSIESGVNLYDVMDDLGHSSIDQTLYYASLAEVDRVRRHQENSYMDPIGYRLDGKRERRAQDAPGGKAKGPTQIAGGKSPRQTARPRGRRRAG
jgi:site-specific recombinase XerD